jgi:N6-L-threonylcarbamoyladenine synthase
MLRELERLGVDGAPLDPDEVGRELTDLFASFQRAVVSALVDRLEAVRRRERLTLLAVSGGVAANSELRATLSSWGESRGVRVLLPDRSLTTDNAAMIAWAGFLRHRREGARESAIVARSRWPLGAASP